MSTDGRTVRWRTEGQTDNPITIVRFDYRRGTKRSTSISPHHLNGSYWRKYVHEVLVNRLGGLSLPRKSVVRLTDRPDMTLDVYRGR